jgi:23S rRNA pseudouridine1911/1915/1917 synthase
MLEEDEISRAEIIRWIDAGRVAIGSKTIEKAATKVRSGDVIIADPLPPEALDLTPDPTVPFSVLYQDEDIIVVDKPAGVVVHPGKGNWTHTLVHGLLSLGTLAPANEGESDDDEEDMGVTARPGIVHRIDRHTSGVLVVARTLVAKNRLMVMFKEHRLERVYDALAVGIVPETLDIETPYGRHAVDRKKFTGKSGDKRAVSHFTLIEALSCGVSRVECRLETGRTHQIRVHLSEHGAPILADAMYGKPARDARVAAVAKTLNRQALHARTLGFVHPTKQSEMKFEAPWPADLASAYEQLRALD